MPWSPASKISYPILFLLGVTAKKGDSVEWQACSREQDADFSNLEHGIDLTLHQDIKAFYGCQYSADMDAAWNDNELTLLSKYGMMRISFVCRKIYWAT